MFGLRGMNKHVNLMVEQYEFEVDETGNLLNTTAESRKSYKVVLHNGKSKSKASSSMHKNLMLGGK